MGSEMPTDPAAAGDPRAENDLARSEPRLPPSPPGLIGDTSRATGVLLQKPWHAVAVLRLLVLVGLIMIGKDTPAEHHVLYWALVGLYGATVLAHALYHALRRRRRTDPGGGRLLFLLDALLVSFLIVLRGEGVPGFLAAYFTLVLMAAIVNGLGTAVLNALVVSVVYAAVTQWGEPPSVLLTFPVVSQFIFFFIVAVFMGHIAQQARSQRTERASMRAALAESTEELRAVREALHTNERVVTLGMMSAGIAHELKNPLAAIMSSLDPAQDILTELTEAIAQGEDTAPATEELREIFQDCLIAGRQLKGLAQDLTSIARGGNAVPIAVDPSESIHAAARILKNRVPHPVRFQAVTDTQRTILADPGRVLQILLNLAGNALDAMGRQEGGHLVLRAEDAGPFHIAFVVEDNGPGIPAEIRDQIFEPFFTTKGPGKGTGLGLHLVREITRALSGTIHLESPDEGGARFRIELPVYIRRTTLERTNEHRETRALARGRRGDDPQGTRAHVPAGAV